MSDEDQNSQIADDGDERRYFYITPNLIEDMGLDVYEHRIWCYLKRWAGPHNKPVQESTRDIARATGISLGNVSQGKHGLRKRGMISWRNVPGPNGMQHEIRLCDLWPVNMKVYGEREDPFSVRILNASNTLAHQNAKNRPIVQNTNASDHEQLSSGERLGVQNTNDSEELVLEEQESFAPSAATPSDEDHEPESLLVEGEVQVPLFADQVPAIERDSSENVRDVGAADTQRLAKKPKQEKDKTPHEQMMAAFAGCCPNGTFPVNQAIRAGKVAKQLVLRSVAPEDAAVCYEYYKSTDNRYRVRPGQPAPQFMPFEMVATNIDTWIAAGKPQAAAQIGNRPTERSTQPAEAVFLPVAPAPPLRPSQSAQDEERRRQMRARLSEEFGMDYDGTDEQGG